MRRTSIIGGLLAAVVTWVVLLSLISPASNTTQTAMVPAADGSRCVIKFVDKSRFTNSSTPGEVTLRMDINDGAGKPIVNLKSTDFEVIEEDLPGRVTAFRGPQSQAINLVLVIDVSGSMSRDNRIAGARQSANAVIEALKVDRDRLAVIPFSDSMHVLRPLETITTANRSSCRDLIESLRPSGGTSIGPPTLEALNLFKRQSFDGAKMVMVMTDGEDPNFARHLDAITQLAEETGAQVHTIGFGRDVGRQAQAALQELAQRCSGQYQHAPSNQELTKIFSARVQETINECTLVYDSPYPQADGLRRNVSLKAKTPNGLLSAGFSYQVGPILGGRSSPADWAVPKGSTPAASGVISFVLSMILFVVLLAVLLAGLIIPEIVLGKEGGAVNSPIPSSVSGGPTPRSAIPLPPPPTRPGLPKTGGAPASSNAASKSPPPPPAPNPISTASPPRPAAPSVPAPAKPAAQLPPPPRPKSK